MKRILSSTTALAVALSSVNPWPLMAQTVVDVDGQQVICLPNKKDVCPEGEICTYAKNPDNCEKNARKTLATAGEPAVEEQAAPGQDAAPADSEVTADPAAEQAAADEAAAKAAAEEQAAADEAAAKAAAEEQAAADEAAAKAAAEEQAPEVAVEETPAADEASPEVVVEEAPAKEIARDVAVEEEPVPDVVVDEAAPDTAGEEPATDVTVAEEPAVVVDAPVIATSEGVEAPSKEVVQNLTDILSDEATSNDEKSSDVEAKAPEVAAAAAPKANEEPDAEAKVTVTEVTAEDSRASTEEFVETKALTVDEASAAVKPKKEGLSDLEKFGLVVVGALVVGAILNNGDKVISNTGDRVVLQRPDGTNVILRDDDTLIRQPGSTVRTETYEDGSTRSVVEREDGSRIITIRDAAGRVLRRSRIDAAGREVLLIDDLAPVERIDVTTLPKLKPGRMVVSTQGADAALRAALLAEEAGVGRAFSLRQIREFPQVRALAPTIDVAPITFASGSSAIQVAEAKKLAQLGRLMAELVAQDPSEVFLIEGHTDAVGGGAYNLALSDRRAESLALALTEYYGVPPENMVVQGYGETELLVDTLTDEARNRRAVVRIISPLLSKVALQ